MNPETRKVFIAGGRYSPGGKLLAMAAGVIMMLSALVLGFLLVGLLLPLVLIALTGLWGLRWWRSREIGRPGTGSATNSGQTMEGEFRVVDKPRKSSTTTVAEED